MKVDILVEIGTPEQKEAIKSELLMILDCLGDDFLDSIDLNQIIIPLDFDVTVNRLQNTTGYTSDRIQLCVGKIIESNGNNYVILSRLAYTEFFNFGKRCKFIWHELYHLVNRKQFTIPDYIHTAESRYLNTLGIMYDEYTANVFANGLILKLDGIEIIGDVKGDLKSEYDVFLSSVLDDNQYYLPIKEEYQDWRTHGDTGKMLNTTTQYIDAAIKDIAYCYSFADSCDSLKEHFQKQKSVFLNDDTENIFKLLREWHASEKVEIDFMEGLDAIKAYMSTCFGITFTDDPAGERFDLVPF